MIVPGGEGCPLRVVSRGFVLGGMVLDKIDTCIKQEQRKVRRTPQESEGSPHTKIRLVVVEKGCFLLIRLISSCEK